MPKLILFAIAIVLLAIKPANAFVQLSDCSQTVGAIAAPVPFTSPVKPSSYLQICNAHAANTLGINFSGGTAAIGSAGTLTLQPGGCMWWDQSPNVPDALSVIGSGAGTTTACGYQ